MTRWAQQPTHALQQTTCVLHVINRLVSGVRQMIFPRLCDDGCGLADLVEFKAGDFDGFLPQVNVGGNHGGKIRW